MEYIFDRQHSEHRCHWSRAILARFQIFICLITYLFAEYCGTGGDKETLKIKWAHKHGATLEGSRN